MRVHLDRDKCIGIGMCEAVAPHIFSVQEDGTLEILTQDPEVLAAPDARDAVAACPTMALTLIED